MADAAERCVDQDMGRTNRFQPPANFRKPAATGDRIVGVDISVRTANHQSGTRFGRGHADTGRYLDTHGGKCASHTLEIDLTSPASRRPKRTYKAELHGTHGVKACKTAASDDAGSSRTIK